MVITADGVGCEETKTLPQLRPHKTIRRCGR